MRPPRFVATAAVLGVLFLSSLSACDPGGREGATDRRSGPPRVGDTIPTVRLVGGEEVPWFAAPTLQGDTVAIADLRGTPVMVNLWATWCPPCRAETPYLQSIHERYDGRLRTVGITVDNRGAVDQVRTFVDEASVGYEILHDPAMLSMDLFGVPGLPATFLLDPDGVVTFARIGPVMEGDAAFEAALEELLGPGSGEAGGSAAGEAAAAAGNASGAQP